MGSCRATRRMQPSDYLLCCDHLTVSMSSRYLQVHKFSKSLMILTTPKATKVRFRSIAMSWGMGNAPVEIEAGKRCCGQCRHFNLTTRSDLGNPHLASLVNQMFQV